MLPLQKLGWRNILILIAGYIALDWASYIHPLHGLNITPWNPAPALGLVFLFFFGRQAVIPLAIAILAADITVRKLPEPWSITIGLSILLTLGYWCIAEAIRHRLRGGMIFKDRRGLLEWAVIIVIGTFINSLFFVEALVLTNLIPPEGLREAAFRYWVGDSVGILVSMPILWMLFDARSRCQLKNTIITWESLTYLFITGVALLVAFRLGAKADFKYFYVLFLPIAWAAARQGLTGAVFSAEVSQLGIIFAVQLLGFSTVTVMEIQILAVALALCGFFIGVVVDEKQRVSEELRQTLRLAAAGEMAGALAHELNQPLTALSAYGTACEQLLESGETGDLLRDTIRHMVAESFRAADVVRRLRDFFRTGATRLEHFPLAELVTQATTPFITKASQRGIELMIAPVPEYQLFADRLQLEVVLRNLLSNAFDAVAEQPAGQRRVQLTLTQEGQNRICLCVEDSGAGLNGATAAHIFEAFQSSKSSGLGLGLAISRDIVEAHGGKLWAEVAHHGIFKLMLPIEEKTK